MLLWLREGCGLDATLRLEPSGKVCPHLGGGLSTEHQPGPQGNTEGWSLSYLQPGKTAICPHADLIVLESPAATCPFPHVPVPPLPASLELQERSQEARYVKASS